MHEFDTQHLRMSVGAANEKGWRDLTLAPGEALIGSPPSAKAKSLVSLVHISDLHICDAQSPARMELLDRFADPHHPFSALVKLVGAYRAQEILSTQTVDAMVRKINLFESVFSKRPIDAVVITGDVTDNAQGNELDWYLTLLHGGTLHPDSGDHLIWEGVAAGEGEHYDRSYWNPEGTPAGEEDDFPRSLYGFPTIQGLTKAVRQSFAAPGLRHHWFSTHGNHDALIQGSVPPSETLNNYAIGGKRLVELPKDLDLMEAFGTPATVGPIVSPDLSNGTFIDQEPDPGRAFNDEFTWATLHTECDHDHGLGAENLVSGEKYWVRDVGQIRLVSLDTVNIHGGWQGSIDRAQFRWLESLLTENENGLDPKYVVVLSHHPAPTLFNLYAPDGVEPRVGEDELVSLLSTHSSVILWLAGHNHQHQADLVGNTDGARGFWHVQTASNIDWPQQGRLVEIFEEEERLVIATSVFDHLGPVEPSFDSEDLKRTVNLAGISRLLSANHWQRRSGEFDLLHSAGTAEDRNRFLPL